MGAGGNAAQLARNLRRIYVWSVDTKRDPHLVHGSAHFQNDLRSLDS
jgi:hypothetical protein